MEGMGIVSDLTIALAALGGLVLAAIGLGLIAPQSDLQSDTNIEPPAYRREVR